MDQTELLERVDSLNNKARQALIDGRFDDVREYLDRIDFHFTQWRRHESAANDVVRQSPKRNPLLGRPATMPSFLFQNHNQPNKKDENQ